MHTEDHLFTARTATIAAITALIGVVMIVIGEQVMWTIGFMS